MSTSDELPGVNCFKKVTNRGENKVNPRQQENMQHVLSKESLVQLEKGFMPSFPI